MATPRTQVSMAGFYDWSTEEFEDVSMPSVYQRLAAHHKTKYNRSTKTWCTDGVHLNPGRMFVRDKADLTKGEREIIAGIYKNRGDIYTGPKNGYVAHVKSHKDAWLVGRQLHKKATNVVDCEKCSIKLPESYFSRADTTREHSDYGSYVCDKCKDNSAVSSQYLKGKKTVTAPGRKAPPTTPENSPKTSRKPLAKPRTHEGAVYVEAGKTFYDVNEGSKKKKVYVDVFLPKFPTPGLHEEPTNIADLDTERSKVTETSKLFQIREQATEHSDEGYSSQEKSVNVKERPNRSSRSRSSSNQCVGD